MLANFSEDLHFSIVRAFGKSFTFLLNSRNDYIQSYLSRGEFYETEELELLATHAAGCRRLLDVGANIGTHSIYLAHRLNLERVTPLECNPAILHILKANLGLNWHPSFDLAHLGKGLAGQSGEGRIAAFNPLNIGGTRFSQAAGEAGGRRGIPIPMIAGDDVFSPGDFDFIKMDIEGMELLALSGMSRLIGAFRGLLFIEVQDDNAADFAQYVGSAGLHLVGKYRRYTTCENWLLRGGN